MTVKYIGKWDLVAVDRDKEYEVMSIERGWFRIMTEIGDYLFPPEAFEIIDESNIPPDLFKGGKKTKDN